MRAPSPPRACAQSEAKHSLAQERYARHADILLNFRTTFVSKGGHVIYDGREIALNYLRGWFTLDLIAALPLEILSFVRNGYVVRNSTCFSSVCVARRPSPRPITGCSSLPSLPSRSRPLPSRSVRQSRARNTCRSIGPLRDARAAQL